MPIYKYGCLDCGQEFERLRIVHKRDEPVACPFCESIAVKRALTTFTISISDGVPIGDSRKLLR